MMYKSPLITLALSAAIILTGCQGTPSVFGGNDGQVDPRLTSNGQAEFFSKSGLQACAGGALAGTAACLIAGKGDKVKCAIIAAVASCGVAMGANYYMERKRADYANREDRIDAYIADVRQDTQHIQQMNESARQTLADNAREIQQIKKQIAAGAIQKANVQKQLANIDQNIAYLNKNLAEMKKKKQGYLDVAKAEGSGKQINKLNKQISQMNQQIAILEKQVANISTQRSAIKLG